MQKALFNLQGFSQRGLTKTLLILKFTTFLLVAACPRASASGYSPTVTLSTKNAPLAQVFDAIKTQTGYLFFWDKPWLKQARKATIEVKEVPLEQALNTCLHMASKILSIYCIAGWDNM